MKKGKRVVRVTTNANRKHRSGRDRTRGASRTSSISRTTNSQLKVGASRIVIEVRGGVVQGVLADGRIGVDVIDFDNARATSIEVWDEAEKYPEESRRTLIGVY